LADGGSAGGGIDMLGIPLWYAAAAAVRLGLLPGNDGKPPPLPGPTGPTGGDMT
jgi:hypothetical protein